MKAAKGDKTLRCRSAEPSSGEYLSGFCKTDRLLPVITLTIFWGADKCKEVGLPFREVLSRIARKFDFLLHESEALVKKYW